MESVSVMMMMMMMKSTHMHKYTHTPSSESPGKRPLFKKKQNDLYLFTQTNVFFRNYSHRVHAIDLYRFAYMVINAQNTFKSCSCAYAVYIHIHLQKCMLTFIYLHTHVCVYRSVLCVYRCM